MYEPIPLRPLPTITGCWKWIPTLLLFLPLFLTAQNHCHLPPQDFDREPTALDREALTTTLIQSIDSSQGWPDDEFPSPLAILFHIDETGKVLTAEVCQPADAPMKFQKKVGELFVGERIYSPAFVKNKTVHAQVVHRISCILWHR